MGGSQPFFRGMDSFGNFDSQEGGSAAPPQEDLKPNTDHINLRVVAQVKRLFKRSFPFDLLLGSQDGNEVFFKIRKTTPMKKLMSAYCERQGVTPDSIRFLFHGQRIQPEQDPTVVSKRCPTRDGTIMKLT